MKSTKFKQRVFSTCIALVALAATTPAYAYSVYRSVNATPQGVVVWNAANFGVSGNPATLSFFHHDSDALARQNMPNAQCFVKVDLPGVADNPPPATQSTDGNINIAVGAAAGDQPRAFPWAIVFDNNPAGHWSIPKTAIVMDGASNNAASRVAAAGFQSLVAAGNAGVTVINGTLANCAAQ